MPERKRPWFRWLIWTTTAIYWLACIYMTHVPHPPGFTDVVTWDKLKHFCGFGLLASLLYLSLWVKGWSPSNTVLALIVVLAIYGALDERTQPWTGRDCDIHDWYADVCGTLFAALCWTTLRTMVKQMPE